MTTETWCRVQVDFFRPTGFMDTWFVKDSDRWSAIQKVMAKYEGETTYVNLISASLCGRPDDRVPGGRIE